jgi:hypothetical protein
MARHLLLYKDSKILASLDLGKTESRASVPDLLPLSIIMAAYFCCTALFFGIIQIDIDIGRDFVVAGQLLQGKVLYHDLMFPYGPLAPWLNSWFFRVFGTSVKTLLAVGATAGLAIVFATYFLGRQILPRPAAAVAALAVAVHAVYGPDVQSYATPYAFAAVYGLLLSLLALYAACRSLDHPRTAWHVAAGMSAGLAAVSKQEFGLISAMILVAFAALRLRENFESGLRAAAETAFSAGAVVAVFAALLLRQVTLAELLGNVYARQSVAAWSRLYAIVGGWAPGIPVRILETLLGFALHFGFVVWAGCFLSLFLGLAAGDRPSVRPVLSLLAGVPLLFHGLPYFGYYPLLLHGIVLLYAFAGRPRGSRRKAGFFAFSAAVFLIRVALYPRSEGYGLLYFAPSLIVYLYLCYEITIPALAGYFHAKRMQAAMTIVFAAFFIAPELVAKYRLWAQPSEPVATERGVIRVLPEEAAKARVVLGEIRRHSGSEERILMLPHGAMYYFLAARSPASRYLSHAFGVVLDGAPEAQEIEWLSRTAPRLIVWDDTPQGTHFDGPVNTFGAAYNHRLAQWIRQNYREVAASAYKDRLVHFLIPHR